MSGVDERHVENQTKGTRLNYFPFRKISMLGILLYLGTPGKIFESKLNGWYFNFSYSMSIHK